VIFAGSPNPDATNPLVGMSLGMGVWAIVLTIIAMYVAGRETGRLAEVGHRHDGLIQGMIMFGLSVVTVLVLAGVGGSSISGGTRLAGGTDSRYLLGMIANMGWTGFLSVFLGLVGGNGRRLSSGTVQKSAREKGSADQAGRLMLLAKPLSGKSGLPLIRADWYGG
jgi:hypothetical protein